MDPDAIKAFESEFGTGRVSLGAFVLALDAVKDAIENIESGGGIPPDLSTIEDLLTQIRDQMDPAPDLSTIELLLTQIRDETTRVYIRQTQTRNLVTQTRNELQEQTPLMETMVSLLRQIERNTRRGRP